MSTSIESYETYIARVSSESIPCYEPSLGAEEIALLTDVINRNWLSESKYTREFESRLATICERKYALAFSNATAAMITGMKSLGLGPGDEVIVPSFAHSADPNSISNAGAVPVFADVNEVTLCLDVESVEAARTPKSKAILYIALYGNSSDLSALSDYARRNGLFLINDCAPALAGSFRGRKISSFGDFAVLSFFADKTITTGEGGMLLTDDADLLAECNIYKHDGRRERGVDLIERRGYNFRLTEMQAAIGVAQLGKLDYFVKRKREVYTAYERQLSSIAEVKFFRFNPDCDAVPHRVLIFVPDAAALISRLERSGIGVRTTFMPMHSQPCYDVKKRFRVTERLFATGVCLPSAPTLTQANIEFVADAIRDFYRKGKR
jgi:perosamine synthetase